MKSRFAVLAALACGLALSACSSVRLTQPFPRAGGPPEKAKLEGVWQLDRTVVFLKFRDDGTGDLNIPAWKDGTFHVDHGELIAVPGKTQNYLCLRMDSDGQETPGYAFAAFKVDDDTLVAWAPDAGEVDAAIVNKRLEGTSERKDNSRRIVISTAPDKVLDLLEGEGGAKLLDYKNPLVLRKIAPAP